MEKEASFLSQQLNCEVELEPKDSDSPESILISIIIKPNNAFRIEEILEAFKKTVPNLLHSHRVRFRFSPNTPDEVKSYREEAKQLLDPLRFFVEQFLKKNYGKRKILRRNARYLDLDLAIENYHIEKNSISKPAVARIKSNNHSHDISINIDDSVGSRSTFTDQEDGDNLLVDTDEEPTGCYEILPANLVEWILFSALLMGLGWAVGKSIYDSIKR
ncbi:hypothetical protein G9A89_010222 [Geosiphon pyriformis]|nr:hypothetical protein G9A89_010222 [Geosiphon pyriformis]